MCIPNTSRLKLDNSPGEGGNHGAHSEGKAGREDVHLAPAEHIGGDRAVADDLSSG